MSEIINVVFNECLIKLKITLVSKERRNKRRRREKKDTNEEVAVTKEEEEKYRPGNRIRG